LYHENFYEELDMLKKAVETGNSLHKALLWETWRAFFFQDF
jgi:hypothetical protein